MGESFWADLDAWQVQQITDAVGPTSAYPDLQVQTVRAVVLETVQDWDNDAYWTFPAVAVMGRDVVREFGGYGPILSFDKTYPYFWTVITTGEQEQATADAKVISARLETLARSLTTAAVGPTTHGEISQGVIFVGNSTLMQYRRPRMTDQINNNSYDHWYILLSLALEFEGKI